MSSLWTTQFPREALNRQRQWFSIFLRHHTNKQHRSYQKWVTQTRAFSLLCILSGIFRNSNKFQCRCLCQQPPVLPKWKCLWIDLFQLDDNSIIKLTQSMLFGCYNSLKQIAILLKIYRISSSQILCTINIEFGEINSYFCFVSVYFWWDESNFSTVVVM